MANGGSNGGKKKNQHSSGGGGGGSNYGALIEDMRAICPGHKQKELAALVKKLNGDKAKIQETVTAWWDDPIQQRPKEEEWEDVNKKVTKQQKQQYSKDSRGGGRGRGGGRSDGGGRGRGRDRGGRGGGRDGDRGDRPGRGRGGRGSEKRQGPSFPKSGGAPTEEGAAAAKPAATQPTAPQPPPPQGVPVPSKNTPALKGAWGARAAAVTPAPATTAASAAPTNGASASSSKTEQKTAPLVTETTVPAAPLPDANTNGSTAPQTARPPMPVETTTPVPRSAVRPGGNVWATKGSAHLIQAEKQPAIPATAPKSAVAQSEPPKPAPPTPAPVPSPERPTSTLESGLPSVVSAPPGAWGQAVAMAPVEPTPAAPINRPPPSPAVSSSISQTMAPEPVPLVMEKSIEPPTSTVSVPPSPAAPKLLNMGHWDDGGADNIDFGFGSFGAADISAPVTNPEPSLQSVSSQPPATATSASPARPPPGLSMPGMPPMPASAVMVHELENKLESASLTSAPSSVASKSTQPATSAFPTTQGPPGVAPNPALPSALTQQNYGQYNMAGMYNYSAPGSGGFVGMHTPDGQLLAGGVVPQQGGKPQAPGLVVPNQSGGPPPPPQNLPQQSLYGSQTLSAPSAANTMGGDSNVADNSAPSVGAAAMPPGMPGNMPYANPAMHYGQHQFYAMGQHQGGIGYNYGYGAQFGGVAQGSFGYQQQMAMGQNQGYGAPHGYEDQTPLGGPGGPPHNSHGGGGGGYQNKSSGGGGGYRGRNNYNNSNNNQYGGGHHQNQQQYGQQAQHHGGYGGHGGQPAYGMGYHAPGGMGDPYAMQQQHQGGMGGGAGIGGGYDDNDHSKGGGGRKGGRAQHGFQQGPPPGVGQQQSFGLQGQAGGVEPTPSSGGWSNQGGGWSGAQSGWQGS